MTDNKNLPKIIENSGLALHKTRNLLSITDKILTSKTLVTQQRIGKFIVQDGIATDTETGLVWLRFEYGKTWLCGTDGIAEGYAKEVSWHAAFDAAKQFNQQSGYAGFTDWRLPAIDELKTLIDKIKGKPSNYIDADVFPSNWEHSSDGFWSSSCDDHYNDVACNVLFSNGGSNYAYKNEKLSIRFVRSRQIINTVEP